MVLGEEKMICNIVNIINSKMGLAGSTSRYDLLVDYDNYKLLKGEPYGKGKIHLRNRRCLG